MSLSLLLMGSTSIQTMSSLFLVCLSKYTKPKFNYLGDSNPFATCGQIVPVFQKQ